MTAAIHPAAVISTRAVLAEDVEVDAYSVIGFTAGEQGLVQPSEAERAIVRGPGSGGRF